MPERRHGVGDRGIQRRRVADVDRARERPLAGLLHEPGGLVQIGCSRQRIEDRLDVVVDVDGDDVGTVLGQA